MSTRELNGAERACAVVGGQTALAARLTTCGKRITPQGVSWWCRKTKAVPAKDGWAAAVSVITGLPLHELNPEVFPKGM